MTAISIPSSYKDASTCIRKRVLVSVKSPLYLLNLIKANLPLALNTVRDHKRRDMLV